MLGGLFQIAVDHRLRFQISETAGRLDEGGGEALRNHRAVFVVADKSGQGEALDAFLQRADAVGKHFRQHRHHAARQIGGVGAAPGFGVQRGAWLDKTGHIGDVHGDLPHAAVGIGGLQFADGQRIVVVLGIRRVDGAGEPGAAILARGQECGILHLVGGQAGLSLHILGEFLIKAVGQHDGGGLGIRLAGGADHAGDHPLGQFARILGPFDDFDHDLVAALGVLGLDIAHQDDRLGHLAAVHLDHPVGALLGEHAGERLFGAFDDFKNRGQKALGARRVAGLAARIEFGVAQHAVAVHRVKRAARGHEQVAAQNRLVGHQKAEAFFIAAVNAGDLRPGFGQGQNPAGGDDFFGGQEVGHRLLKQGEERGFHAQSFGQGRGLRGFVTVGGKITEQRLMETDGHRRVW